MHYKESLILKLLTISLILFFTGLSSLIKPAGSFDYLQVGESIPVKLITVDEFRNLIEERKGKPLLINVWATWCVPCREEYPDLVKIADVYSDKIDVIGISVDFTEEIDSKIIPFLKKYNPNFTNFVIKVADPEDFINLLNGNWSGAIPATFIYDEKGDQKEFLLGKQTYKDFEKEVWEVID